MTEVRRLTDPALEGTRRALVLLEDRVGHYPEFRDFLAKTFELDRVGLAEPGYVEGPSGLRYVFVFVGRSGEPFPAAVEIHALPAALEPLDDEQVDHDLWAILRWIVAGVGAGWRPEMLDETGRLLRVPAATKQGSHGTAA